MIYIIQGQEELFIRQRLDQIIRRNEGEIFRFDGSEKDFTISAMLEACQGNSLFSSGSIVLVQNPFFLCKKIDEKSSNELLAYIGNPVFECQLVLYTLLNNFNQRLKIYKQISENAQVITLNSYDHKNFNTYMRSRVIEEKLSMDNDAIYLLGNLCKRNATLLNQNLEILKLYPEKIDSKAVSRLCTASDENDSFELINALTGKDVSKAVSIERKMLNENDSVLSLLGLLSNQLRFLYEIAYYQGIGKKRNEILELTGINEYRLNKANESLQKLNKEKIMEMLAKLSDLDVKCKSDNSIPGNTRFELFILELLKG